MKYKEISTMMKGSPARLQLKQKDKRLHKKIPLPNQIWHIEITNKHYIGKSPAKTTNNPHTPT